ncbi:hypothetical protein GCM10010245_91100 [Streptomyces spectabilis]|nr:hypothetical protein GCM10010245_91100 [Streptomyces spectabilis]
MGKGGFAEEEGPGRFFDTVAGGAQVVFGTRERSGGFHLALVRGKAAGVDDAQQSALAGGVADWYRWPATDAADSSRALAGRLRSRAWCAMARKMWPIKGASPARAASLMPSAK